MQAIEFPYLIFKAYDIRGIVGVDWDAYWARKIGQAIGTLLHEKGLSRCVIGRDGRLSGLELMQALIEGVCSAGIDVSNIGCAATPAGYFAGYELKADAVLVVTASHNSAPYNGIKMVIENRALAGEDIQDLKDRVHAERFFVADTEGRCELIDIHPSYKERIVNTVRVHRRMRVAIDCGNGIMALHAPDVLRTLGVDVVPLYCTLDGAFPNHEPDPSREENVVDLRQVVLESGCELGLAFDGDGDRLVVMTRDGVVIDADRLLMLFSNEILKEHPEGRIVYDVKCTRALVPWVKARGGVPVLARTGHSFIKAAMREVGGCLGGEMSGHLFFADRWYGFDDGLYAAARLLELLSAEDDPSAVLHALPKMLNTPEIHWRFESDTQAHTIMSRIAEEANFPKADHIHRIDGLRVEYPRGFGLIRASNTSPLIVLRFEGDTADALAEVQADFNVEIKRICGNDVLVPRL